MAETDTGAKQTEVETLNRQTETLETPKPESKDDEDVTIQNTTALQQTASNLNLDDN